MTRRALRGTRLLTVVVMGGVFSATARAEQGTTAAPSAAQATAPTPPRDTQMVTAEGLRAAGANRATDPALEKRTSEVAAGLRCPVCQGLSIQDSPSELAQQMRSLVRDQLAAGKTPEEVRAYFISKYGEWILLEPEASGFNVLVYVLPVLLVLGGLGFIVTLVRRWTVAPVEGDVNRTEES